MRPSAVVVPMFAHVAPPPCAAPGGGAAKPAWMLQLEAKKRAKSLG
jgi:hypothetical protein